MSAGLTWIRNVRSIDKKLYDNKSKTTGVFEPTLKMLKLLNDSELLKNVAVIHGANPDSAVTLRDNIELTKDNSKTYGREQWMKEICPTWKNHLPNESG